LDESNEKFLNFAVLDIMGLKSAMLTAQLATLKAISEKCRFP